MDLMEATEMMISHAKDYYGNCHYFVIFLVCMLMAFLYMPEMQKKIIYPTLVLFAIVLTPFLFQLFFLRLVNVYWRLFWMIPSAIVIAYVFCQLSKQVKKRCNRVVFCLACILLICCFGNNIYTSGIFCPISNIEKISDGVGAVSDTILSYKEDPLCLVRDKYLTEMRQYSADIRLVYGRNVYGYVSGPSDEMIAVADSMESEKPDYNLILSFAERFKCDFVVTHLDRPIDKKILKQYHYHELDREDWSIIYVRN